MNIAKIEKHSTPKLDINEANLLWLAGFAEGDGSWQVIDTKKDKRSLFLINQQDPQVLYKFKDIVGHGQITGPYKNKNGSQYFRYRVGNLEGTKRLIEIFNGRLVLNKTQERFSKYVNMYNSKQTNLDQVISIKKVSHIPTLNDGWLSGFIDAEGSFSGTMQKKDSEGKPSGVRIRFTLVQKDETEVMLHIKEILGATSSYYKKSNTTRLFLENNKNKNALIQYLENFPLKSSKKIPFQRFNKIHQELTSVNFKWTLARNSTKERLVKAIRNMNHNIINLDDDRVL